MRRVRICLFCILICCQPLTAQAENKKIVISCTELASIEIKQPPPGYLFSDLACSDKCFYLDFIMEDAAAIRLNAEVNAYKNFTRELYIDDTLLFKMEPFYLDLPYSQKMSNTTPHPTMDGAVDEAQSICPKAVIKLPETVRY